MLEGGSATTLSATTLGTLHNRATPAPRLDSAIRATPAPRLDSAIRATPPPRPDDAIRGPWAAWLFDAMDADYRKTGR